MKPIVFYVAIFTFIISCKNHSSYTEKSENIQEKNNQTETNLVIDSTSYRVDSLNYTSEHSKKFNEEKFTLTVYISEAIRKEEPDFKIDYAYFEINCSLKEGEHYFTQIGENNLPYMKHVVKYTNSSTKTSSHTLDREGKYNKISILNFDKENKKFDLDVFFNFSLYGNLLPMRTSLKISNISL